MSRFSDWASLSPQSGLAILLPGARYTAQMPLLHLAGVVADHHGWVVREVSWDPAPNGGGHEVGQELEAAIDDHPGPLCVIGKSLGTRAAPWAARRGLDAVWLTPLLGDRDVVEAIRENPGRQLLIGGTADRGFWDPVVAAELPAEALELPGADHSLHLADPVRTAEALVTVVRAIDRWFAGIPATSPDPTP